jgi:recombination protein RecA
VTRTYGAESSGKTTWRCTARFAQAQAGCRIIDAEHAQDINYAKKLGVNIDDSWFPSRFRGEASRSL